jgi:hypothetical protein
MNQIERSFAKLQGKLCWGAKRGFGSFLTLEFASPRLVVRELPSSTRAVSRRVQKLFARRLVSARGRWHLWIYCCEWRVDTTASLDTYPVRAGVSVSINRNASKAAPGITVIRSVKFARSV